MTTKGKKYRAKVGCWNCDDVYELIIKRGMLVPQFLTETKPQCRKCGCAVLKMFSEYTTRKKIMKDVLTHLEITQISNMSDQPKKQHQHFG